MGNASGFGSWSRRGVALLGFALGLLLLVAAVSLAEDQCDEHNIEFLGSYFDGTNTTFEYRVTSGGGQGVNAISHWVLGFPELCADCSYLVDAGPGTVVCGNDPTTGVYGIKFDDGFDENETRDFWITLEGYWPEGQVQAAIKAGPNECYYTVQGPACPEDCNSELSIDKTADVSTAGVGETINYTITVSNTGDVPVEDINVEDDLTGDGWFINFLDVGASEIFYTSYTVTEDDLCGDLENTATAEGYDICNQPVGPVSDSAMVQTDYDAEISLSKEADVSEATVGDTVSYTITVTNDGNVTLFDVTINDAELGLSENIGEIAPGSSHTLSPEPTYTVSEDELPGPLANTATVQGTDPCGFTVEDQDSATVELYALPGIELTKEASDLSGLSDPAQVGDEIIYTFTVENTGNVTLTDVSVSDSKVGQVSVSPTTLSPGQEATGTATYAITQADIDAGEVYNLATGRGYYNGTSVEDEDDETVTLEQQALIALEKTADPTTYSAVGEEITYAFRVENTGNVTLTGVTLEDLDVDEVTGGPIAELAPGQVDHTTFSATYEITQADLDRGYFKNTATVTGYDPDGSLVTDEDAETVDALQNADIALTKTADPQEYSYVGQEITYSFEVKNTGNVTLTDVVVEDPLFGQSFGPITLDSGEQESFTYTYAITQADIDAGQVENTATATGYDPNNEQVTDEDEETITADQSPAISLDKEATDLSGLATPYPQVGNEIVYTFTVENTGNVTLTDVEVTDSKLDLTHGVGTLAPGASSTFTATYAITQADIDAGEVYNLATATGYYNGTPVEDEDDETVPLEQQALIALEKTADPTTYSAVGDEITYAFRVENTGNVTLSNVTLDDPQVAVSGGPIAELAPGQVDHTTFSATYAITQDDLDAGSFTNTATVTGYDPNDDPVTDTDGETVTAEQDASISIEKTADADYATVGDDLEYTITVTNTGNVTLTDVTVTDGKLGLDVNVGTLAPGATHTLVPNPSYTVQETDLPGPLTNTADVIGYYDTAQVTDEDEAVVELVNGYVTITPQEDTNEVGDPHVFTITAYAEGGQPTSWALTDYEVAPDPDTGPTVAGPNVAGDGMSATWELTINHNSPETFAASATVTMTFGTDVTLVRETDGAGQNSGTATKEYEYRQARITLEPQADTNEVEDEHEFTATVEVWDGGEWVAAPDGTEVEFSFVDNPIGATFVTATTTTTIGGLSSATITASESGVVTVGASADVYGDGTLTATTGTGESSPDADKTYVDGTIEVTPGEAWNELNDPHVFTITAYAEGEQPTSWELDYSVSPSPLSESLTGPNVAGDGMSATWTLEINHDEVESFAVSAEVTMAFDGTTVVRQTDGLGGNSEDGVKHYVDGYIEITPEEDTNVVGDEHVFTVAATAEGEEPTSWSVDFEVTPNPEDGPTLVSGPTGTGLARTWTYSINSSTPGTFEASATVTMEFPDGTVVVRTTDGAGRNTEAAQKDYIDVRLNLTPEADTNVVGDDHVFTATLEYTTDGTTWQPVAGETVTFAITGGPGELSPLSAVTDAQGQATATLSSTEVGSSQVTASYDGLVEGASVDITSNEAEKDWIEVRLSLTPEADTNVVGDDHVFTATLEWTSDGVTWQPVAGEEIAFELSGVGELSPLSAVTDGSGQATTTLTSTEVGSSTVTASYDGLVEGASVDITSNEAEKDWVDGYVEITPQADTNELGDPHVFVVTAYAEGVQPTSWELSGFTVTPDPSEGPSIISGPVVADDGLSAAWQVEINHNAEETFTALAEVTIVLGGLTVVRETDGTGQNSSPATKEYVELYLLAEDASYTVCMNESITFDLVGRDPLADPDEHPLTFTIQGAPENGVVSGELDAVVYDDPDRAAVEVTYTPNPNFLGTDTITFRVTDPFGEFAIGVVDIEVVDCGDEPVGGGGAVGAPIAINEIAWQGTPASISHQWVELLNTVGERVDLDGWILRWRRRDPVSAQANLVYVADGEEATGRGSEGEPAGEAGGDGASPVQYETRVTLSPAEAEFRAGDTQELTALVEVWDGGAWRAAPDGGTVAFSFVENEAQAEFVSPSRVTLSDGTGKDHVSIRADGTGKVEVLAEYREPWKEVELEGYVEPHGYYVLERESDTVICDLEADLIYDTEPPYELYFTPEGDVIELLDSFGNLMDTANADNPDRTGWAAGYGTDGGHELGTMERIDPLAPDIDDNWQGNRRIITTGIDADLNCIIGTPGAINEETLIRQAAERLPREVGVGAVLAFSAQAPEPCADEDCLPRATLTRVDPAVGGAGTLVEPEVEQVVISGQREPRTRNFVFRLDTSGLEPGEYSVWISMGGQAFHHERIRLVP